jgi:hypothetical protein
MGRRRSIRCAVLVEILLTHSAFEKLLLLIGSGDQCDGCWRLDGFNVGRLLLSLLSLLLLLLLSLLLSIGGAG